jgi:hypothetical protein
VAYKSFRANLELRWDLRLKPGSRSCCPNGRVPGTKQGPRFGARWQILCATCWHLFRVIFMLLEAPVRRSTPLYFSYSKIQDGLTANSKFWRGVIPGLGLETRQ